MNFSIFILSLLVWTQFSEIQGGRILKFLEKIVKKKFHSETNLTFSSDFRFGVSMAAYQSEGEWNKTGKGLSIWDKLVHDTPHLIVDNATGDVATDSYNRYEEDLQIARNIGFQVYRFSISWPRIMPTGEITQINKEGVKFYDDLIDKIIENKMEPMVTIYHWDLPQKLQELGGWLNPLIADYFEDYADFVFKTYGHKVKWWNTINEPLMFFRGYAYSTFGGAPMMHAPNLNLTSPADYIVGHNLLLAHARAYRHYQTHYKMVQKGKLSIALNVEAFISKTSDPADEDAAERSMIFNLGWFAHPIYSSTGDYHPRMREIVDEISFQEEGRRRSRLPVFTKEQIQMIRGSADFFAMNYYTAMMTEEGTEVTYSVRDIDIYAKYSANDDWKGSDSAPWLKVVPAGLHHILERISTLYGNPPIYITENGYPDSPGTLDDYERINYHVVHLEEILKVINSKKANVIGYNVWSLLDVFEWSGGYKNPLGIVHVDHSHPNRPRTLKKSCEFFKQLLKTRILPKNFTSNAISNTDFDDQTNVPVESPGGTTEHPLHFLNILG